MRKYVLLTIDLFWVGAMALIALLLRDSFNFYPAKAADLVPYIVATVTVALIVVLSLRLNREVWRYASLPDLMRVLTAATMIVIAGVLATLVYNRFDGIARSIPVIHWFLLVGAMCGTRIAVRLVRGQQRRTGTATPPATRGKVAQVLVVGVNEIAELYIRSINQFAHGRARVAGLLTDEEHISGRIVQGRKVLGRAASIAKILDKLDVHGVAIDRVVITESRDGLSEKSLAAINAIRETRDIEIEFFADRVSFIATSPSDQNTLTTSNTAPTSSSGTQRQSSLAASHRPIGSLQQSSAYRITKRLLDVVLATLALVVLLPVTAFIAVAVAIDVGFPLSFWQQRPGQNGRAFRLTKFRTMRGAFDRRGRPIADEQRSSAIGAFLRRTRLDEIPQLLNILVGEMSFVGPRPLLPRDLPSDPTLRLSVPPGITGWAQVNGGREVSISDKDALDTWYVHNASLMLDLKIFAMTVRTILWGEKIDSKAIADARAWLSQTPVSEPNANLPHASIATGPQPPAPTVMTSPASPAAARIQATSPHKAA